MDAGFYAAICRNDNYHALWDVTLRTDDLPEGDNIMALAFNYNWRQTSEVEKTMT